MTQTKIRTSPEERGLQVVNTILVTLFMLICVYPFYYVIICSFSSPDAISQGVYFLPVDFTLSTYQKILERGDIFRAFYISCLRTVLGTALCVFASSLFAFLVTKQEMFGRKFIYRLVITTMYLNAGLIPWYITLKAYGFKNNFLVYIIPGAVNAFYIILVKTYFAQLPASLEESAELDGAGFFTIFTKIILPLSKPIIATVAVYCAVGQWNCWMDNYFFVTDSKLQTMQLILYNYLTQAEQLANSMRYSLSGGNVAAIQNAISHQSVQMTVTVMTIVPILCVYPSLQKYFAKGIMLGAVKG